MTNIVAIQDEHRVKIDHSLLGGKYSKGTSKFTRGARARLIDHLYSIYQDTKDKSTLFAAEMLAEDGRRISEEWEETVRQYEKQKLVIT